MTKKKSNYNFLTHKLTFNEAKNLTIRSKDKTRRHH